jgi:hypothetical protein
MRNGAVKTPSQQKRGCVFCMVRAKWLKIKVQLRKTEFRDASLPRSGLWSRRIELSWNLQNNGKKGIRLCKEVFMCDLK